MEQITRILVGVDREKRAIDALGLARALAEASGADLHVLHVVEATRRFWPFGEGLPAETVEREGMKVLDAALAAAGTFAKPPIRHVRQGHPVREIDATVRELAPDLLVLGRHHEGMLDPVIGGTVERVIRKCPCPVLVHKRPERVLPRRILAGVDLSPVSLHALRAAIQWASSAKARLQVLYVFEPPVLSYPAEEIAMPAYVIDDARQAELAAFAREMKAFDWCGVDHVLLELDGDPARVLLEVAKRDDADLMVVGTHGRTGLDRFLLGSVAEHVARHAATSVLVVPGGAPLPRRQED